VERHLVESLAPVAWMLEGGARRWIDFGSGAGLPAIPIAIAGVGEHWSLVESRRSKVLFLLKYLQDSGLQGIEVIHDRLESVVEVRRPGEFDGFTSRATMALAPTLAMAASLVKVGGEAFLWKGSGRDEELRADPFWRSSWEHIGTNVIENGPTAVLKFVRK
jgi:16S rRNA (guanine527-N7)-methyltransferase